MNSVGPPEYAVRYLAEPIVSIGAKLSIVHLFPAAWVRQHLSRNGTIELDRTILTDDACHADNASFLDAFQRVRKGERPDQLKDLVECVAHLRGNIPIVDEDLVDTALAHDLCTWAGRATSRSSNKTAVVLRDRRRRETDGCGSSAHKQTVTGFELQRLEKRAVRRLQHLRHRANDGPVQVRLKALCVRSLDARVLCVSAIEVAAHTAHCCRHFLALLELAARAFGNDSGGLDAQNARELDAGRMALPGEHLGTVEPECFDADEDLVVLGVWDGEGFDLEHLRATGLVDDGCFH